MSKKKKIKYPPHAFVDGGTAVGIVGTALDLAGNAIQAGKGVDTSEYLDQAKAVGSQGFSASSTDDLLAQWNQRTILDNKTYKDITGNSVAGGVLGSLANIGSAAAKGMMATKSPWGALAAVPQLAGEIAGAFNTANKIKNLNREIDVANFRQDSNFATASDTLESEILSNALANYAANGGPIHIAPSKRGTFTAAATKHGMGVQEFASHVLANKDDYSTKMIKKAVFAKNFGGHKHDAGGLLSNEFTNGVIKIDNGDSHEENPLGGVIMGIAPDGLPNQVEEGELVYNNYVYSNRLKVPKAVRNKYKLRGPKDMTFAEAFEKAQKESEERENDPISQNGLDYWATVLAGEQEAVRPQQRQGEALLGALGGHLFAGGSVKRNIEGLNDFDYTYDWVPEDIKLDDLNIVDALTDVNETSRAKEPWGSSWGLRTAPIWANLSAVGMDLAGKTNTPTRFDYIPNTPKVSFSRLGNYMPRTIFDMSYEANQREAQNLATLNALRNTTSANRGANILQQGFNANALAGEALNRAFNTQLAADKTVLDFNRGTDQINSQGDLTAQTTNASNILNYANARLNQANQNESNSNAAWGARAKNIENLAAGIGGIGTENLNRDFMLANARSGVFGILNDAIEEALKKHWGAYGGKLKKKRGGFTY